jgi:AraC-like DNA-binding protein
LSELAFTEALRRYAQSNPPELKGWLAGLQDPYVGRALALLHGDPARGWTVEELAREVALSRSALAERFTAMIGEPPVQYLMRWRLTLAAQALRNGSEAIARIAQRSGYDSEASFTRAFKREFGMPPAVFRKTDGRGPAVASAGRPASSA